MTGPTFPASGGADPENKFELRQDEVDEAGHFPPQPPIQDLDKEFRSPRINRKAVEAARIAPSPEPVYEQEALQLASNQHAENEVLLVKVNTSVSAPTRRDEIAPVDTPVSEAMPDGRSTLDPAGEIAVDGEGADLLDDVAAFIRRYVALPSEHALVAAALWVVHTHAIGAFDSTPRLCIQSPEMGSGKTRLLEVMELITPIPRRSISMTPAAMFRSVHAEQPTLLLDETDTYLGKNTELLALVNAGHRRGAVVCRVVGSGDDMVVREFRAFAAVALAGIGDFPGTVLDRSVLIRMRRRAPNEPISQFRVKLARLEGEPLRCRLARWAEDHLGDFAEATPDNPLSDRPADVWEPLLAIADVAGGTWPERARAAAHALNAEREDADPSLGVRLLADIKVVFGVKDFMRSADLVKMLCALEESPWGDLGGKTLDARGLAKRLKPYGIGPAKHRIGIDTVRGYARAAFHDAWSRYLPTTPVSSGTAGATEAPESDVRASNTTHRSR